MNDIMSQKSSLGMEVYSAILFHSVGEMSRIIWCEIVMNSISHKLIIDILSTSGIVNVNNEVVKQMPLSKYRSITHILSLISVLTLFFQIFQIWHKFNIIGYFIHQT